MPCHCVMNEKDLGVIIDSKLQWSTHCEMILQKATKQFNLLRRTCYFIFDSRQKRVLYLTLVRSILEHGIKYGLLKAPKT